MHDRRAFPIIAARRPRRCQLQRDPRYARYRAQTFGVTWLAYAGFYLTRKSFSVAKIGMAADADAPISSAQMASIDGAYLIAYALGQFMWGMCGDRFGPRKVVLTGMACSVAAAALMGASTSVVVLGALFFVQGMCQSSGWAPLSKNLAAFFSQRERGRVMGMWCTSYAFGSWIAGIIAGYAGDTLGYRYAFYVPAGLLLLVWLIFYFLQHNKPEDLGLVPIEEYNDEPVALFDANEAAEGSWAAIAEVYKNPTVLLLGAVYLLLKPARYAILFWGPMFMNERLGTDMASSGFLSGLFELAGVGSTFAAGWVSDRVFGSRRMPVCVICLFMVAVLLVSMRWLPDTPVILGVAFFAIGLLVYAPDSLVSGAAAVDFGSKKGASSAAGLVNGCGSAGAIVGGTLPGLVMASWGWNGVFLALGASTFCAGMLLLPKWNLLPDVGDPDCAAQVP